MPGEHMTVVQLCRENRVDNAEDRARKQEPCFTRFLTKRTKHKINTLKWERDGLLREINLLRAELAELKAAD